MWLSKIVWMRTLNLHQRSKEKDPCGVGRCKLALLECPHRSSEETTFMCQEVMEASAMGERHRSICHPENWLTLGLEAGRAQGQRSGVISGVPKGPAEELPLAMPGLFPFRDSAESRMPHFPAESSHGTVRVFLSSFRINASPSKLQKRNDSLCLPCIC